MCPVKTKPIFLSVVYRPPSKGSDLESTDQLCAYLKECDSKLLQIKEVFICGDFNCNMLCRFTLSSKIKDLCSSLSLKQLIEEPTRVTPHSSTLLDLIMTNSVNISKAGVIDPGVSDHSFLYTCSENLSGQKANQKSSKFALSNTLWRMIFLEILEIEIGPIFLILMI